MKIKRIEFIDNPILGNLVLDFTDSMGNILNTVILAGENGTGKSLILNAIYNFMSFTVLPISSEKRIFNLQLTDEEVTKFINNKTGYKIDSIKDNSLKFEFDYSKSSWQQISCELTQIDDLLKQIPGNYFIQLGLKNIFISVFSDVDINFTPSGISAITSKKIDNFNKTSEKSNSNLATEITQLLIDIQSEDSLEFAAWAKANPGSIIDQSKLDIRMSRFSQAFEKMFPTKKYKNIETINGLKVVNFEENGHIMSIKDLSSGEKQVVFRGSFLLKDKESINGAIILIDEPEISMHPKWQLKIMSFFKTLFTKNNVQTSQIFVATHSPFIIHNATRNDDKVIILKKNDRGIISVSRNPQFYSWSDETAVQEAFNLAYLLHENLTTVFIEGETDEKYYKKAMEIYGIDSTKIDFQWIGRISEKGGADNSGDRALNNAFSFFKANPNMLIGEVVLLYDSDTNKPEVDFNRIKIKTMHKNEENTLYKAGVENLLSLPTNFDKELYYKKNLKIDNYGAESTIKELDKTKLCDLICNVWSTDQQKVALIKLKIEIEKLLMPKEVRVQLN